MWKHLLKTLNGALTYIYTKAHTLASELESINEETISETHLEIIEKSDGERHGGAAVVESRHILG